MPKAFEYEADPGQPLGTLVLEMATRTLRDRIASASVEHSYLDPYPLTPNLYALDPTPDSEWPEPTP